MERFTEGQALPAALRSGVAALGNFDGFHAGHQAVAGRALALARERGAPGLVVTFDPHPASLFIKDPAPFALTTIDQRLALFEAFGVDAAIVIPFDRALASLTAEQFFDEWLTGRLGIGGAVTGDDFTFGKARSGDTRLLRQLSDARGLIAETVAPVTDASGETISSTRVRVALKAGDCPAATALLTRPFTITGLVEPGAKLGRTIGVPTANIPLGGYQRPRYGVYAVRAVLPDGRRVDGVANLGIRPMFDPPVELLEAHLFDFDGDLYGSPLAIELHAFLRDEWKLPDLDALKRQIAIDCANARRVLA